MRSSFRGSIAPRRGGRIVAALIPLAAIAGQATTMASEGAEPSLPAGVISVIAVADGPILLAAAGDSIWVEAHRANHVSQVDPLEEREVARLTHVRAHWSIAVGAGHVWATEFSGGTLTKADPESGDVVATIRQADACGLAVDDDEIWVTSPAFGSATRYDPVTLEAQDSVSLGEFPFEVAIAPDAVWAAGEADGGRLWRIDPAGGAVDATLAVPGVPITRLEFGFDSLWAGSRPLELVYRIDPLTVEVVAEIELPYAVGGLGVGRNAVWVSGFGDGRVHRIDPASNTITGTVETGFGNLGPPLEAFDSVWVAALDRNVLARLDPGAFAPID